MFSVAILSISNLRFEFGSCGEENGAAEDSRLHLFSAFAGIAKQSRRLCQHVQPIFLKLCELVVTQIGLIPHAKLRQI